MTRPIRAVLTAGTLMALLLGGLSVAGVPAAGGVDPATSQPAAQRRTPVLGQKNLFPYDKGFGEKHPRVIDNGGVPSGTAKSLDWRHWGRKVTVARGRTSIYHPDGGYYAELGRIKLRAKDIGRCTRGGPPAYTRLSARVSKRPDGSLGPWFRWAGRRTICRS
jgi:hypothetical protein